MPGAPFVSIAQNGEDVVLRRAFADVEHGRYVDVGANDPDDQSVTRAFYDRGWQGITIEPVSNFIEAQKRERPRDIQVQCLVGERDDEQATLHQIDDTGLSTVDDQIAREHADTGWAVTDVTIPIRRLDSIVRDAGWDTQTVQFLKVDVEGAEESVLRGVDLSTWRPEVVVVEATRPLSVEPNFAGWEPLLTTADYRFVLFDGVSRFYVAAECWDRLHHRLQAPANPDDGYTVVRELEQERELRTLKAELGRLTAENEQLSTELDRATDLAAEQLQRAESAEEVAAEATVNWRLRAESKWSAALQNDANPGEVRYLRRNITHVRRELELMKQTLSWRITAPLRAAKAQVEVTVGRFAPVTAPTAADKPGLARSALASRLRTAAGVLLSELPEPADDPVVDAATLLQMLAADVGRDPSNDRVWLLITALTAALPDRDDVDRGRRELELAGDQRAALVLLDTFLDRAVQDGSPFAEIELVVGAVVVDADQSARHDLHTGIQQVTRNLLPRWQAHHHVVPTAWTDTVGGLRALTPAEEHRVLRWSDPSAGIAPTPSGAAGASAQPTRGTVAHVDPDDEQQIRLVVPWRSVVVLVDVPEQIASQRLAAIAEKSGNRLVAVAHDAIPITSADMIPLGGSGRFGIYLSAIKFAKRVAGVSVTAAAEMSGFIRAVHSQGLPGPAVVAVPLASHADPPVPATAGTGGTAAGGTPTGPGGIPMILVVGSHEPRKNHLAILHSAELLWSQGHRFSLEFIGGMGWGEAFPRRVAELTDRGRPVRVRRAVSDEELHEAFDQARFTMFPSLHEGFGIPVVESFAHRTPVITADFGSTAESAVGGGALLVDPRDDAAITAGMRSLLTDDALLTELQDQISRRPHRSWADYADELWAAIVAPELQELSKTPC